MRRVLTIMAAVAFVTVSVLPAGAGDGGDDLGKLRGATAQFRQIDRVIDAGYQLGYIAPFLLDHCIANPTEGGMGYHYFNHDMIHDTELDALSPEGMVYAPGPNGQLKLAAVEWIVPVAAWEAAGNTEPPVVLGQEMHILNPALGWYILHAWVWKNNPSGMFQDWNPEVVCD